MIQPYVELVSSLDDLILDAIDGWGITAINLGDPETRANVQNAAGADGTLDYTTYVGARVITLNLELVEAKYDMWTMLTRLRGFMHPRLPMQFVFQMDDNSPKIKADIRRSAYMQTLDNVWIQAPQMQWVAPKGIFESFTSHIALVHAGASGTEVGRSYDLTFDRTYPASPVLGSAFITNAGNLDAYPVLRVYGPCTDPILLNVTVNKKLEFDSLTIDAGEYLEVDTRNKTIRYQSDPNDSRYGNLNFTTSTWWTLIPGVNEIRFLPATYTAGTILEVEYNDAYL